MAFPRSVTVRERSGQYYFASLLLVAGVWSRGRTKILLCMWAWIEAWFVFFGFVVGFTYYNNK